MAAGRGTPTSPRANSAASVTRLSGWALHISRLAWLAVLLLALVSVASGAPSRYRRFYRARHEATQAIVPFSVRLRGGVDLDPISVIHDTIHPALASVWLGGGSR